MSATASPLPAPMDRKRLGLRAGLLVVVLLLATMPVLNQLPVAHPLHVSDFLVSITGKWICYAILALSLDLAWGYAGILSLGHGAFFALGGYAMGMHLMRLIGPRGVYGHPVLPDFMVFLGYRELPWYWLGFDNFAFAMLMVLLVPGVLALVLGWLAFRSRITGVYLSIITQAMTYALMLAFFRNDMGFGGNNGFTDFKRILGYSITAPEMRVGLFALTAAMLLATLVLGRYLVTSKLGRVLAAIRDAESRVMFIGYNPLYYKLFIWTLSALLCGIAGALYVPQVGIINPGEMSPANSIEMAIWVAVGGRGTLIGPVIGAFVVNLAKSFFTVTFPEYWLFFLGAIFVGVTLWLPDGVVGLWRKLREKRTHGGAK